MVHHIDPILGTVFGVHLWWYGLSYTFGLLNASLFVMRNRARIGLTRRESLDLSLCLAAGALMRTASDKAVELVGSVVPGFRDHLEGPGHEQHRVTH